MEIFISWSGERSRVAAEALRDWLPKVINAIKPWLSSADIDKGTRWPTEIASRLEKARAGIICLTPANIHADWILFEAGALSKTIENTYVSPLLIGLEPSQVGWPLAQFQLTRATKEEVSELLKTLNRSLGDQRLADAHLEEAFQVWWPKLENQLKNLPKEAGSAPPKVNLEDRLDEILGFVRELSRSRIQESPTQDFLTTSTEHVRVGRYTQSLLTRRLQEELAVKHATEALKNLEPDIRVVVERPAQQMMMIAFEYQGGRYCFEVPRHLNEGRINGWVHQMMETVRKAPTLPSDRS
jgi:hypothetical protein